ncbi:MAG: tRNA (guanosine(37)-N1)-methyltransferase TrmD [Chlamydiae bacterium]|nr:tRNA (guanosine(37)-N1)-methyltransferase TrmD [Chlamydiota bacterium]
MRIDILSLFPSYFRGPFDVSILKRAQEKKLLDIHLIDIRDFAEGKHRKVDDHPYGGGSGMVLMAGPVVKAIRSVKEEGAKVIYLTPQGKLLDAEKCLQLSKESHLILVCGHYEGIDKRIDKEIHEEISIGNYVLTNGCLAAIVLVDGVVRFIPGVLGSEESAMSDSFEQGMLEGPQYTRPENFEGMVIPEILKSGHHAKIKKWREEMAKKKTEEVRSKL